MAGNSNIQEQNIIPDIVEANEASLEENLLKLHDYIFIKSALQYKRNYICWA